MPLEQTIKKLAKEEIKSIIQELMKDVMKEEMNNNFMAMIANIRGSIAKGDKGEQGIQGLKGLKGDKGEQGEKGADGRDGKNGKNGIDGKNGKDGSSDTGEQIINKINKSEGQIDVSRIKGLPELKVDELKEGVIGHISSMIGTRRNIARIVREKPEVPRGTIDGSNKDFYLSRIPFGGFIILVLNGVQQKKDDDFTMDGSKISYTTAPPLSSNHQAIYF